MGVNDLWPILEPVKQHVHLQALGGKTIAVDLSLWVCEAQTVKKMMGAVAKPHLRNLFFRISYLTQMDVKLVFVMEGEPPKLKADVMSKRNQTRYGPSGKTWSQKTGRSHFKSVLRECTDMLECLGVPWVQAAGEAEAMCAYLNAHGHVDGCLTNDGDAFLYGAQTVYRNFTMNVKDPHVDCYTVSSIKSKLGLDRDALVGLAILLGCDYLPKGVPGVGKEQALKLTQILKGQSLLQRFNQWMKEPGDSVPQALAARKPAHCSVCSHPGSPKEHERSGCQLCESDRYCEPRDYEYCCPCEWHRAERNRQLSGTENSIRKKACSCQGFPFHEVIQEFLLNKDKLMKPIRYQRPDLLLFQRFTLDKMEWPNHYACEKLLVLLTRYDMMERKLGRKNSDQLQPVRIIKPRIRNGVRCLEIEWEKPEHYAMEDAQTGELLLVTIEDESLFEAAYPEIVAVYQKQQSETKGKKQKNVKTRRKGKDVQEPEDLVRFQSFVTLRPTDEIFPKQNPKINLRISPDPQEPAPVSWSSLVSPQATPCLDTPEQTPPPPKPAAAEQTEDAKESLISDCGSPGASPHSVSAVAALHLSAIDWEGTSFANSPAPRSDASAQDLHREWEPEPSALSRDFEIIPEQLPRLSGQSSKDAEELSGTFRKVSLGEGPRSVSASLCFQDLPLRERMHGRCSRPGLDARPRAELRISPLLGLSGPRAAAPRAAGPPAAAPRAAGPRAAGGASDCPSRPWRGQAGVPVHGESGNSQAPRDRLLAGRCPGNVSMPRSYRDPRGRAGRVPAGHCSVHVPTAKKTVKSSVCLERESSDEEGAPAWGGVECKTRRAKHGSRKHHPAPPKERDPNIDIQNTQPCLESSETAGDEESRFSDPVKRTQRFLQGGEERGGTSLESPLPLSQRLQLRFQSRGSEF